MNKPIFLSYARDDYAYAYQLQLGLAGINIVGWMDKADIAAGDAIGTEVRSALQKSAAFVLLVSPNSVSNSWINFEVGAAQALQKPIIPIFLEGSELPETLHGIQFLDARDKPIEHVVHELEQAVQ